MTTRNIVVVPYDEKWKFRFEEIAWEVSAALGELALSIEHVGSTSVEGLAAKPIIDIDVVIEDENRLPAVVSALAKIGYQHEGNYGIPGREAFGYEGKTHLMEHHLYVCPKNSPELRRHLSFRNYLRGHPEALKEYSRIKEEAARLFPHDIDGYINHKGTWIEKIYKEIGCEK